MNNQHEHSLNDSDKDCLISLQCNFELAEILLGQEPLIYHVFNQDTVQNRIQEEFQLERMEIFKGSFIKINN